MPSHILSIIREIFSANASPLHQRDAPENFTLHHRIAMNKLFGKWLSFLLVIIVLTASTNNSIGATTAATLSGWPSNPAEGKLLELVLQKFETAHPNIKVKYEAIADRYMEVLQTRLIGDAAADVFFLDAVEAPLMMASAV